MICLTKTQRALALVAAAGSLTVGLGSPAAQASPSHGSFTMSGLRLSGTLSNRRVTGAGPARMPASSARRFLSLHAAFRSAKTIKTAKPVQAARPLRATAALETRWSGQEHLDWGVFPSVQVYGAAALQSVNPSVVLPSTDGDDVYAPTMDPSNQSCLEITTTYLAGRDSVSSWDWCSATPGWKTGVTVNSDFTTKYTTMFNGHPVYAVKTLLTEPSSNTWTSYLYDWSQRRWDTFDHSSGTSRESSEPKGGWDMFEVYTGYNPTTGQGNYCSDTRGAVWASSGLSYVTSIGADPVSADPTNSTVTAPGGDDGGCDSPPLTRRFDTANSAWTVSN